MHLKTNSIVKMNIIQKQKQIIDSLQEELAQLRADKAEIDADIKTLAKSLKTAWDSLGIDLEKLKSKSKAMALPMVLAKITKKEVQNTLENEWDNVSKMLEKYTHLTKKV